MNFAQNLKSLRAASGLTQEQLAHACGYSGQSRIGNYESGSREPELREIPTIAQALGVEIAALWGLQASTTPSHSLGIDAATLVEAEKLMAIEESISKRHFEPAPRMRRIAELYDRLMADGGELSRQHMDNFIKDAQQAGETGDGHSERATPGRKAGGRR
jgi:transcriptional regulator with XRE-family HTH domain